MSKRTLPPRAGLLADAEFRRLLRLHLDDIHRLFMMLDDDIRIGDDTRATTRLDDALANVRELLHRMGYTPTQTRPKWKGE